jgi:hypothetical protein
MPGRHRIRSWRDLLIFNLASLRPIEGWLTLIGLIFLIVSILSFVLGEGWLPAVLLSAFAILSIIVGVFELGRKVLSLAPEELEQAAMSELIPNGDLQPDYSEEQEGYVVEAVQSRDDLVLRSPRIDDLLRAKTLNPRFAEKPHHLKRILEPVRALASVTEIALKSRFRTSLEHGRVFHNEKKIGLASDLTSRSSHLDVFRSSYFVSFLTNELCTRRLVSTGPHPSTLYDGTCRFPLFHDRDGGRRLKPISQSGLGNHIGISSIAISSDLYLCFWRQGKGAQQSARLLAPTGSGSCDWSDLCSDQHADKERDAAPTLLGTIQRAMTREYEEESSPLGRATNDGQVIGALVLGYFRWVSRGGKPEFVGVTKLSVPAGELYPNTIEVDSPAQLRLTYPAFDRDSIENSIEELLCSNILSVPLFVNLMCLREGLNAPSTSERVTSLLWG